MVAASLLPAVVALLARVIAAPSGATCWVNFRSVDRSRCALRIGCVRGPMLCWRRLANCFLVNFHFVVSSSRRLPPVFVLGRQPLSARAFAAPSGDTRAASFLLFCPPLYAPSTFGSAPCTIARWCCVAILNYCSSFRLLLVAASGSYTIRPYCAVDIVSLSASWLL